MSGITCPRCGAPVALRRFFNPASKPFCTRCGWNLDRVETTLQAKSAVAKLVPLGIIAVGLLFAFMAAERSGSRYFFVLPAMLVFSLIGLIPLWGYNSTRKAIAAAKFTVNPDLAQSQPPPDASLQMLQSLPRPRRVRLRFPGAFAVFAVMGLGLLIIAMTAASWRGRGASRHSDSLAFLFPFAFIVLLLALVVVVVVSRERRNLPLLRDGELAFARVTSQRIVPQGKSSYSEICFEFRTNAGEVIKACQKDVTGKVFEDMTIPVFYDPLKPSNCAALCSTYYRFVDAAS